MMALWSRTTFSVLPRYKFDENCSKKSQQSPAIWHTIFIFFFSFLPSFYIGFFMISLIFPTNFKMQCTKKHFILQTYFNECSFVEWHKKRCKLTDLNFSIEMERTLTFLCMWIVNIIVKVFRVFDVSPFTWNYSTWENDCLAIITQFRIHTKNEMYHFHKKKYTTNATKLNCNTNDEINMEFISINIKWNTEFNIFAWFSFCGWVAYTPKFIHKMFNFIFRIMLFCIQMHCENANWNKFLHRTEKSFRLNSNTCTLQNRNNEVYKRNNPFNTMFPFWPVSPRFDIRIQVGNVLCCYCCCCSCFCIPIFVLALVCNAIFSWMFLFVMRAAVFALQ